MNNPEISVIMSVFDTPYLEGAAESILNQTFTDFEFIIIVDNPENQELIEIVNNFAQKDERIVVSVNEKNMGLANSLNKGLDLAKGQYIARMDSDDISLPERLEKQKELLDSNPKIGLCGTCAIRIDEEGNETGEMILPSDSDILAQMLPYTTAAYHPSWMFRKDILENVKGYRPFPVAQDYDFLYRCIDNGIKLSNIQEPLFKYRIALHNASVAKFLDQWNIRKYIQRLHRERVKTGSDSFCEAEMQKVLIVSNVRRKLCGASQELFEKGVIAKRRGRWLMFGLFVLASVMVYPPKLAVLYSTLRSKLIQK